MEPDVAEASTSQKVIIGDYVALRDDWIFRNLMYASSIIDQHRGETVETDAFIAAEKDQKKRIEICDGIALLLDTKGEDCVAVSMMVKFNAIDIVYARNDSKDITNAKPYLSSMIQKFKEGAKLKDITDLVIDFCSRKIIRRLRKMGQALEESRGDQSQKGDRKGSMDLVQQVKKFPSIERTMRERHLMPNDISFEEYAEALVNVCSWPEESIKEHINMIFNWTWCLTITEPNIYSLNMDQPSVRRIAKVAAYVTTILNLRQELKNLPHVQEIGVKHLATPEPERLEVENDLADAANIWLRVEPDTKAIRNLQQIKSAYSDLNIGAKKKTAPHEMNQQMITIKHYQHAELTVALWHIDQILSHKSADQNICIGISKAACYYCHNYIQNLESTKYRVICRYTHNKCFAGWKLPAEPRDSEHPRSIAAAATRRRLAWDMKKIHETIRRRARSSSGPPQVPQGDLHKRQQSMEVEMEEGRMPYRPRSLDKHA